MDGPTPPTPYRDGKPLADIIPPDHRRAKAVALVIASMIAGVSIWVLGGWALEEMNSRGDRPVPPTPGYVAGRIAPAVLHGPGGGRVMPPKTRSVIHVWLQGCQDCMPAFEAMRELEDHGGLGVKVPIINVAYGEADATWAARYRVDTNLVYDLGGASVVKPLGIGTFTTLVVDSNGSILHRDRPDRAGYRERVRAAVGAENVVTEPAPDPEDPFGTPDVPPQGGLDSASVARVVAMHRSAVKRACWDRVNDGKPSSAEVTISVTVAPDGKVRRTSSTGNDPMIAKCVEDQIKTWTFPAHGTERAGGEPTTLSIPFKFVQQ